MRYIYPGEFVEGIFVERPNRFLAKVDINGQIVDVHVKNTSRMREIVRPGKKVYLLKSDNPNRKTKYDLITIEHGGRLINIDSQIPNKVVEMGFLEGKIEGWERIDSLKREVTIGNSRLDMVVEQNGEKLFVEVKGVDYIKEKRKCSFPGAPTERGRKHLLELERLVEEGQRAMVIFLVVREEAVDFRANFEIDPKFAEIFYKVLESGVEARAYKAKMGYNYIEFGEEIPIVSKETALADFDLV